MVTSISSLKTRGATAPPKLKLLAGPMVVIHTKIVPGIQCVYTLVIGTVHWTLHFKSPC